MRRTAAGVENPVHKKSQHNDSVCTESVNNESIHTESVSHEAVAKEPIHVEITVPIPRKEAFFRFTKEFNLWWPREYTWSKEALVNIGLEPRAQGRCTERGPEGFQSDWGRVLTWRPPERLVLAWQISPNREPQPNPAQASTVELLFCIEGPEETRIVLSHRDMERHGKGSSAYREALASPMGWPFILKRFADFVGR